MWTYNVDQMILSTQTFWYKLDTWFVIYTCAIWNFDGGGGRLIWVGIRSKTCQRKHKQLSAETGLIRSSQRITQTINGKFPSEDSYFWSYATKPYSTFSTALSKMSPYTPFSQLQSEKCRHKSINDITVRCWQYAKHKHKISGKYSSYRFLYNFSECT